MPTLPLSTPYELISEGEHLFTIVDVNYDKVLNTETLYLVNEEGKKHQEKYKLLDENGQPNQKVISKFSYFVRNIIDGYDNATEVIDTDLVGIKFYAQVSHDTQLRRDNSGDTITFLKLDNFRKADAIDTAPIHLEQTIDDDLPF